jgi:hypothetical protein
MRWKAWFFGSVVLGAGIFVLASFAIKPLAAAEEKPVDYRAWGEDHVEQELPEYTTGTECLFCHRDYVAPRWKKNAHNRTMREAEPSDPAMIALRQVSSESAVAKEAEILLGSKNHVRFMKKLPGYGVAALSGELFLAADNKIRFVQEAGWHEETFNQKCAGCHATAIDTQTVTFGTTGLDCYVCHGILELEHANDTTTTLFAKKHEDDPRVVTSVCGQCHLRGGTSTATGRPYPTVFVAGDNLFKDFQVDWTDPALVNMDKVDRHIFENARDVMTRGSIISCTSCHSIHDESSEKHQSLDQEKSCEVCHDPGKPLSEVEWPKTRSNKTCQYP